MRQTCQIGENSGEPCGKPAVDFVDGMEEGEKRWLCAKHWDFLQRLRQILEREHD